MDKAEQDTGHTDVLESSSTVPHNSGGFPGQKGIGTKVRDTFIVPELPGASAGNF